MSGKTNLDQFIIANFTNYSKINSTQSIFTFRINFNHSMYREIDTNNWPRKQQYDFFKNYDDPFYNIVANIDITKLYSFSKEQKVSFFLSSLYLSLKAANEIPEFRYRIEDEKVVEYEKIDAKSTILDEENTFLFCRFEFSSSIKIFCNEGNAKIKALKKEKILYSQDEKQDIIHYSVIPWVSFTSYSNARNIRTNNSIPKIVFGKHFMDGNKKLMPLSVEVNHALVDGYHVGKYFEKIQHIYNHCADYLD